MINSLVAVLSVVGALAVISFIVFFIIGFARGWQDRRARIALIAAAGLGIACAVIGVLIALGGS